MYKGKSTCRELKKIRKMIAEAASFPDTDVPIPGEVY